MFTLLAICLSFNLIWARDPACGGRCQMHVSLNRTVNPCENFYEFSCGGWIETNKPPPLSEPVWGHWQTIGQKINKRLKNVLKNPGLSGVAVKAQKFYKNCVGAKRSESKYLKNLKTVIAKLKGWPLVDQNWTASGYNWLEQIGIVTRLFGIHPILKIHVAIDLKNTTQHIIYIEPGSLILPEPILTNPKKYSSFVKVYKYWITKSAKHLFICRNETDLNAQTDELIKFEIELAKLSHKQDLKRLKIGELHGVGIGVFKKLFQDTKIKIDVNETIVVKNFDYLSKLLVMVQQAQLKTVVNYLMWSVVSALSRETTKFMRNLNFMMDSTILGVRSDLSRSEECVQKVNEDMGLALVPQYVNFYYEPQTSGKVHGMIGTIKKQFIEILEESWLSGSTKKLAIEKIEYLKPLVAYPDWVMNETALEDHYKNLNFTENHFINFIRLKTFTTTKKLATLRTPAEEIEWPSSPLEVNAYYSILQNSIIIPLGILEPPFYDPDLPDEFNYGALGNLIGHEISHSLDTTGRHADKNGLIRQWWPETDVANYRAQSRCFEEQYSKYGVDSVHTLGENVADNVGLQISYGTFKSLKARDSYVPFLETYTRDQLFFISFAQLWCEVSNENLFIGEHAPVRERVLGTLENSQEFKTAFNCIINNKTHCALW